MFGLLQCQSSVSVSPWDTGNKFPDVTVCCGGTVNFQWSVRPSIKFQALYH